MADVTGVVLALAVLLLVLIVLLVASVRTIRPYEAGLVIIFGSFRRTLGPGFHFVPLLSTVRRVDLRPRSIPIPPQTLATREGALTEVAATVRVRVVDPARSVFASADWEAETVSEGRRAVAAIVSGRTREALLRDPGTAGEAVNDLLREPLARWGIGPESVTLATRVPGATVGGLESARP